MSEEAAGEGHQDSALIRRIRESEEKNRQRQAIQMKISLVELTLNRLERIMVDRDLNGPEQSEYNQAVVQARELNQQLAKL